MADLMNVLEKLNLIVFNAGKAEALAKAADLFEKNPKSLWAGDRVAMELRSLIPPLVSANERGTS